MRAGFIALALTGLTFCFCTTALAQSGSVAMLAPWPDQTSSFEIKSSALFQDKGRSRDTAFDTQLFQYEVHGRFRLDPSEVITPTVVGRYNHIDIRSNDPALPQRLVDMHVATGWGTSLDERWRLGIVGGVGYAGDTPFDDGDAVYFTADLLLGYEFAEKQGFAFILNYDGNRSVFPDVPLPAVAYYDQSDENLQYVVGLPISSVKWKPHERWRVHADYVVPFTVNTRVEYDLTKQFELFAAFENRVRGFRLETSDRRRLFFQQRRVEAGVRWVPSAHAELVLAGGYAFGQKFKSGWDMRDPGTVRRISDEPYLRVGLNLWF